MESLIWIRTNPLLQWSFTCSIFIMLQGIWREFGSWIGPTVSVRTQVLSISPGSHSWCGGLVLMLHPSFCKTAAAEPVITRKPEERIISFQAPYFLSDEYLFPKFAEELAPVIITLTHCIKCMRLPWLAWTSKIDFPWTGEGSIRPQIWDFVSKEKAV